MLDVGTRRQNKRPHWVRPRASIKPLPCPAQPVGTGVARPEGFEPPTNGFGSHYSIRLSYGRLAVNPGSAASSAIPRGAGILAANARSRAAAGPVEASAYPNSNPQMSYERFEVPIVPAWKSRLSLYWQLVRGDRPIGWLLLLWPTWWGLWLAADGMPPLWPLVVFTLGVWLTRSA